MQQIIRDEQHFQVLGTNFSIGASQSGYDLMFSADGISFTKLFSVGAGVNRQVTQVAAGSYYYLSGNTGEVTINWMKDCGGSGSGGGSYVLPIASENTLGGVKIGSGITIDENGAISAQGGSGSDAFHIELSAIEPENWTEDDIAALQSMADYLSGKTIEQVEGAYIYTLPDIYALTALDDGSAIFKSSYQGLEQTLTLEFENVNDSTLNGTTYGNYRIVSSLSDIEEPYEGLMAYVLASTDSTPGIRVQNAGFMDWTEYYGTDNIEGYIARVHWGDWDPDTMGVEDLLAFDIYQSNSEFFWDWNNDGKVHDKDIERDGNYYKIKYISHADYNDQSSSYFEFFPVDETPWGDYKVQMMPVTESAVTSLDITTPGKVFTYNGETWIPVNEPVYDWDVIAPADSAATEELLTEIRTYIENGVYPKIFYSNTMLEFYEKNQQWVRFSGNKAGGDNYFNSIYLSDSVFEDNGFDGRGIRIDGGAMVSVDVNALNWLAADYSDGALHGDYSIVSYGNDGIWKCWFKGANSGDTEMSVSPLKWRNFYESEIDGNVTRIWVFSADIPFNTANGIETWNGVWAVRQDDWYSDNADTLSWTKVSGPWVDSNYPVYVDPNA